MLNCNTDQTYKVRFHSFPKDEKLKKTVEKLHRKAGFLDSRKIFVLSVRNILKTNTFPDEI